MLAMACEFNHVFCSELRGEGSEKLSGARQLRLRHHRRSQKGRFLMVRERPDNRCEINDVPCHQLKGGWDRQCDPSRQSVLG
jgi:hypothetical protein